VPCPAQPDRDGEPTDSGTDDEDPHVTIIPNSRNQEVVSE
jgi:hypothetical protein